MNHVIAAIDVGTNSIHMVVARATESGFEVITREKSPARLGEGGGDMKALGVDAMNRGVAALAHMRKVADVHGASIFAVATSAVREANNGEEFIARAATQAGVDVRVISGVEEARLIHLGAFQALPLAGRRSILIDIGGGSTEVIVADDESELFARSFKIGAVRLTNRFFPDGIVRTAAVQDCRRYVESMVEPVRREIRSLGHDVAVASSGTAETIARIILMADDRQLPSSMNGVTFSSRRLSRITAQIVGAGGVSERRDIPGMDPARADIIVAGSLILDVLAESFRIDKFTFSDFALREGVLLDATRRLQPGVDPLGRDIAVASARKLCRRCDNDPDHAETVARIAMRIFEQLCDSHEVDPRDGVLLECAALLANTGLTVSHARHHLHSYYIIRNADLLGLSQHDIELVAQVARYHRKSEPKGEHPAFAALGDEDKAKVTVLAGVLRVAIGLDRTHDGRVTDATLETGKKKIRISASARDGSDISLNLYAANERRRLLEVALHAPVVVEQAE